MPSLARIRALWSGFQGAPGYSNFFFSYTAGSSDLSTWGADVLTLFTTVRTFLPADVTITIAQEAMILDVATGKPVGEELVGSVGSTTGQGPGAYSAPTGFCIHWMTGIFNNGRQIKGTTYFVPAANSAFQSDGSIDPDALNTMINAGNALIANQTTAEFGVYSRPHKGAADGKFTQAVLATVPDRAVVLRSRRD